MFNVINLKIKFKPNLLEKKNEHFNSLRATKLIYNDWMIKLNDIKLLLKQKTLIIHCSQ